MSVDNNQEIFQRLGNVSNGQVLYQIRNSLTNKYKDKYIVPQENTDKFEKISTEIYNQWPAEKVLKKALIWLSSGICCGAGLFSFLTRKSSTFTKVASALVGSFVTGIVTMILCICKAGDDIQKQYDKIGVKPYIENNAQKQKTTN